MKIFKIQFPFLALFLLFISCVDKNNEEVVIRYLDHSVYVKMNPNADAKMPPIYHIHFKIKNVSNQTKVFFARGNSFDKSPSEFFLIDTLQKIKIPLYTGSIHIMKPNKEYDIYTDVEIRDLKSYFKLPETFFDTRIDFSSDKILLEKLLVNMINSSTIHYKQDTSDVYQYRLFDKDVRELKNNNWILVSKPAYIDLNK